MTESKWEVKIKLKVKKKLKEFSPDIWAKLAALIFDIENYGPIRGDWPNYSKLQDGLHHCHLKKGKPTYVAVWEEIEDTIRVVEVIYVGTHEKAPY